MMQRTPTYDEPFVRGTPSQNTYPPLNEEVICKKTNQLKKIKNVFILRHIFMFYCVNDLLLNQNNPTAVQYNLECTIKTLTEYFFSTN